MAEVPERPIDAEAILRTLSRHAVDFVVIGGFAVQTHGHLRTTKDLDIIPTPSSENLVRLGRALEEIDAQLRGVDAHLLGIDVTNARHLAAGANFTLTTRHGWLDVFAHDETLEPPRTTTCERAHSRLRLPVSRSPSSLSTTFSASSAPPVARSICTTSPR